MDDVLYEALNRYYHALENGIYMEDPHINELLVMCFYRDFVYEDYRGLLSKENYVLIEKALSCLFGTSCLIPYPDYIKMGKLHLGDMTELAQRMKNLEDVDVMKMIHSDTDDVNDSDVLIVEESGE